MSDNDYLGSLEDQVCGLRGKPERQLAEQMPTMRVTSGEPVKARHFLPFGYPDRSRPPMVCASKRGLRNGKGLGLLGLE